MIRTTEAIRYDNAQSAYDKLSACLYSRTDLFSPDPLPESVHAVLAAVREAQAVLTQMLGDREDPGPYLHAVFPVDNPATRFVTVDLYHQDHSPINAISVQTTAGKNWEATPDSYCDYLCDVVDGELYSHGYKVIWDTAEFDNGACTVSVEVI